MVKVLIKKPIEVEIRKISINMKVRDTFECKIYDNNGNLLEDYEGYVPGFMPGEHYGDYLRLDIDPTTGQILNWDRDKAQRGLKSWFEGNGA